jgi:ABC-type lipoprotein export system ATPase subunit
VSDWVIQATKLEKSYQDGDQLRMVLSNLNFQQAAGSFTAITGASGCGKTTLLHVLAGLDSPTTGSITLCGQPISELSASERNHIHRYKVGFVYQQSHLLTDFSVCENVAMPLMIQGLAYQDAMTRAHQHLASIQFERYAAYYPHQLSGGMQQKVALARASVHKPEIIFADEPTGNLDPESTQLVMDYLTQINREHQVALCLVTHDHQIAAQADQRIDLRTFSKDERGR